MPGGKNMADGGGESCQRSEPRNSDGVAVTQTSSFRLSDNNTSTQKGKGVEESGFQANKKRAVACLGKVCGPLHSPIKPTWPGVRWVIIVTFVIYNILMGPQYFNWVTFSEILYRSGVYEWLCTDEAGAGDAAGGLLAAKCKDQELAVTTLLTAATAGQYTFALIGGLLLDLIGPKLTAMLAVTMEILAWCLLACASESASALYIIGMLLLGAGVNTSLFPLLGSRGLFPSKGSTVISIFGASRTLSFSVPLVLNAISKGGASFRTICLFYIFIPLMLCLAAVILFIPYSKWPVLPLKDKEEKAGAKEADGESKKEGTADSKEEGVEEEDSATLTPSGEGRDKKYREQGGDNNAATVDDTNQKAGANVNIDIDNNNNNNTTTAAAAAGDVEATAGEAPKPKTFWSYCCSWVFVGIVFYFCITLLRKVFYLAAAENVMQAANPLFKFLVVFCFVLPPFLGLIADRFGIMWSIHVCNTAGLFAFLFLTIPSAPAPVPMQFISAVIGTVFLSYVQTQYLVFIGRTYPEKHIGRLCGTGFFAGGMVSLLARPMKAGALAVGYTPLLWTMVGISVLCFLLLLWLTPRQKKTALSRLTDK